MENKTKKIKKTTLEDVMNVIGKWSKDNDTSFLGSFVSFNKKSEVFEDRLIALGSRETINIHLEAIEKELKKEKGKFINW